MARRRQARCVGERLVRFHAVPGLPEVRKIVPVATTDSSKGASDTVPGLWKDSGLLAYAMPGHIDPIGRRRLRRLAERNPPLLRELLPMPTTPAR